MAYVRWTNIQLHAFRFAPRQKLHGSPIDERNVAQIQHHTLASGLQTQQPLQLDNVLDFNSSNQRKDSTVRRSPNLQHLAISRIEQEKHHFELLKTQEITGGKNREIANSRSFREPSAAFANSQGDKQAGSTVLETIFVDIQ